MPNRKQKLFYLLLFFILVFAFYGPALTGPFFIDDPINLGPDSSYNDLSYTLTHLFATPRSLVHLSFSISSLFFGIKPMAFKIGSVFFHALNSFLIFLFLLVTLTSPKLTLKNHHYARWALLGALLFAFHPIQTAAVNYSIQRYELVLTSFFIGSLYFYILYRQEKKVRNYLGALFFAFLASFAKETSILLPLVVILYEAYFLNHEKLFNFKKILLILPLFTPTVIVLYKRTIHSITQLNASNQWETLDLVTSQISKGLEITRGQYLLAQTKVIPHYLETLIFPVRQQFIYENTDYLVKNFWDVKVILSAFSVASLFLTALFLYKRSKLISFGIVWFFLTNSLTSTIFPLSDVIFDHREYLPSIGFVIVLTYLVIKIYTYFEKSLWFSRYKMAVYLIPLFFYGAWGFYRNYLMGDSIRMYSSDYQKIPYSSRLVWHYWAALLANKDYEKALEVSLRSYEIDPQKYTYIQNLAGTYFLLGQNEEALKYLLEALEKAQSSEFERTARINLAYFYARTQEFEKAHQQLDLLIEKDKTDAELYVRKGNVYLMSGDKENANKYIQLGKELFAEEIKTEPNKRPRVYDVDILK